MQTYPNKHNLNIIKKYQHYQKVGELKKIMKLTYKPFCNVTSIRKSHVSTISIIQHNSDVIKKRNHLNK